MELLYLMLGFIAGVVISAVLCYLYVKEQNRKFESVLKETKTQYAEQLASQKLLLKEQSEQQMELIKEQMNGISERILKERTAELDERNQQQLSTILNPLQEGIKRMNEAVEKSNSEHKETMVRLDESIKTSIKLSQTVGERADKLAQALTGENKTQGNFGELKLKQLLQDMGLEEGTQYEAQITMKDAAGQTIYNEEDGCRMIPDYILHFPDNRDAIIDSKMSLTAFEEYHIAEDDTARQIALRNHIDSLRKHVSELSKKNYSSYLKEGRAKLDFVFMYVYNESALQLAFLNDPSLWKYAYDKGVIITGSQNLYMVLRVLEITWRQVRQVQNQENIIKAANEVVNRVQAFYERFNEVDKQLKKTQEAFDNVANITASSGKSIEVAARKLLKYGVQANPQRKYQLKSEDDDNLPE